MYSKYIPHIPVSQLHMYVPVQLLFDPQTHDPKEQIFPFVQVGKHGTSTMRGALILGKLDLRDPIYCILGLIYYFWA